MANIEMVIDSIRVSLITNEQRVVVLKEKDTARYLSFWIGDAEAGAIAVKSQGLELARPLAHDFTCTAISALGGRVKSAIINKLEGDTFYAKVILESGGKEIEVDCRPSDALAVAIKANAPIFADERVLGEASVILEEEGV
jgi:bifunctional DNase/RNase